MREIAIRRSVPGPLSWLLAAWLALTALSASSQTPEPSAESPAGAAHKPFVLRVYNNLIQLAALALNGSDENIPGLTVDRFRVTLGDRKTNVVRQVRPAGNDPISLTVVIDASGSEDSILPALGDALASLVPVELHPVDTVSIYAFDCRLMRTYRDQQPNAPAMREAVTRALRLPGLHGPKKTTGACYDNKRLFNVLASVIHQMPADGGRRVVLVISDGDIQSTGADRENVKQYANHHAVAVFSLTDYDGQHLPTHLKTFCEATGGISLYSGKRSLAHNLQRFVALLRSRYIIEFPRPDDLAPGSYTLHVSVSNARVRVFSSGITVPSGNPETPDDTEPIVPPPDADEGPPAPPPPP